MMASHTSLTYVITGRKTNILLTSASKDSLGRQIATDTDTLLTSASKDSLGKYISEHTLLFDNSIVQHRSCTHVLLACTVWYVC